MITLVIYDIEDDRIRQRVSEICKDYGLERIQYSAFSGKLSRNRREELFLKLSKVVGRQTGKIIIQPLCEKDVKDQKVIVNEKKSDDLAEENK
ncbi:MAG: CRISPR-associated endonuclease Cas2 [Candidatus Aminicenantes bacterium]|nr:CRISPR-associated endonuclease Cas2 [Candidatus Aminicenantes bacterium]